MFRQHGSLVAVVWQDKRPVHMLSTLSQPEETQTVSRRERDGSVVDVSVPSAILTYTKYMGGVDLGDQLRKYYSVHLKCVKNFFRFLFDFIVSKLCNCSHGAGRLKAFRVSLAQSLIGSYNSRQRPGRRSTVAIVQPISAPTSLHSPHHHARQRCVYCRYYRSPPCRRESVWQCLACEGGPTLCLTGRDHGTDCWAPWHAQAHMED